MKSREGTVVDADDLMDKMVEDAKEIYLQKSNSDSGLTAKRSNSGSGLSGEAGLTSDDIARMVGLGALKYFILKVDPRKNMLFNPEESIDFNGNTGPFIQYTYARIRSVLRKAQPQENPDSLENLDSLDPKELALIQRLMEYPAVVRQAGQDFSPAVLCNYAYALACDFNSFYHDCSILNEPDQQKRALRLLLSQTVARTICDAMSLLGIEVPERM